MDIDFDAIAKGMAIAVPYIAHMGIEVTEMSEGEATAVLPDRPELHNHVGSQHAGALFGVAETASGAAFVGAFAIRMGDVTPTSRSRAARSRRRRSSASPLPRPSRPSTRRGASTSRSRSS
jgi:acyl-coenzyme A thioesterase PaaI-like protein